MHRSYSSRTLQILEHVRASGQIESRDDANAVFTMGLAAPHGGEWILTDEGRRALEPSAREHEHQRQLVRESE